MKVSQDAALGQLQEAESSSCGLGATYQHPTALPHTCYLIALLLSNSADSHPKRQKSPLYSIRWSNRLVGLMTAVWREITLCSKQSLQKAVALMYY